MNEKKYLRDATTDDLLREAAGRDDLPDAVSRLGAKALFSSKQSGLNGTSPSPLRRTNDNASLGLPTPTAVEP